MHKNFLIQYVQENTRKSNILDLFLTNDPNFVSLIQCKDINFSDHNIVKIYTTYFNNVNKMGFPKENEDKNELSRDFSDFNLNSANFNQINYELDLINWTEIVEQTSNDDFPDLLNDILFSVLSRNASSYSRNKKRQENSFKKKRRITARKLRKLKKRLERVSVSNRSKIQDSIKELNEAPKQSYYDEMNEEEEKAVEKIKTNSRYFFKYVKKFKNSNSATPTILIDSSENFVTDPKQIADCFQTHFKSVFSKPSGLLDSPSAILDSNVKEPLSELVITTEDIIKAINEIKMFSAAPKFDIPARIIKECKSSLALPLKMFWQKSYNTGEIPHFYKTQQIIPLYKKGSRTSAVNYRPISLTSHIIKIFERVLREKLVNFLERNNIINSNQHGFRKNCSCLSQLLSHTNNIFKSLEDRIDVDTVYVDFSKAFDKVDHQILLKKIKIYGITGKYHKWISNFLTGRKQIVCINNTFSYETPVISGVPQGSVLGPLLFVLYVNDMTSSVKYSVLHIFADDTKLSLPIATPQDQLHLQMDLDSINKWAVANKMILNKDKYELICHEGKRTSTLLKELPFAEEFFSYMAGEEDLYSSTNVRELGIIMDPQLNWKDHIMKVKLDAIKMSCWILNVFKTRNKETMMLLFNSLVRSRLEYCSELWDPGTKTLINEIEQVQRRFTHKIDGLREENYWKRLEILKILSLQRRRERKNIIYVWKIKNSMVRNDIELEFEMNSRRSKYVAVLKPMLKTTDTTEKIKSAFEQSFIIRCAKLWNKLPTELMLESHYSSFIYKLDKWLDLFPDKPPVQGYSGSRNSLIDYNIQTKTSVI